MTSEAVRIALAGCGRIAERAYLPALRRLPGVQLAAAIDPREDRRRAVRPLAGDAGLFASLEDCLASVPLDAVIVATSPESHLAVATSAVRAGLALLIEKPLALELRGVHEFEAAVRQQRVTVAMGFNRRFWRPVNELRTALVRGKAGRETLRLVQTSDPQAWAPVTGGGGAREETLPLDDLASHQFDLLRYLTGAEIATVACRSLGQDEFAYDAQFDNGLVASGRVAYRVGKPAMESIAYGPFHVHLRSDRIAPAGGAFRRLLDAADALARRIRRGRLTIFESYERQVADFAFSVATGRLPRATLADGIAALRCVDAAARSAARGGAEVAL